MADQVHSDKPEHNKLSALYTLLVQQLHDRAVFLVTPEGTIASWNPGVEKLLGYRQADWVGRPISIIFTPEDRERGEQKKELQQASETGTAADMRWHLRKDGSRIFVDGILQAIREEDGTLPGFFKLMRDATEHQQIREALHGHLESISDAFYAVDSDFRFTYVNKKAEEWWGRRREDLIGKNFWSEFPAAEGSESGRMHRAAMSGRRPVHYETISPVIGRWIDVSIYPEARGGLSCYFQDISERKKTEQALRESKTRYEFVARATNDVIWDWDLETDSVHWNQNIETLFGYEPSLIQQDSAWWADKIYPEDRERVLKGLHGAIRAGSENWSDEYRFQRADGSYADVFDRGFLLLNDAGKVVRMVGSMLDVTARRRAEARVRESEERFRNAFAHAPVGMVLLTPQGRLIEANQAYRELIACGGRDPGGVSFLDLTHPDDRPRNIELYRKLMQGEIPAYTIEKRYVPHDERTIWVRATATLLRDAEGAPEVIIGLVEDIDERRRAEEDRERLLQELARSNQDLLEFAHMVSHDLQAPLRMVKSYAQLLHRRYKPQLDGTANEFIRMIVDGAETMGALIRALLQYAQAGEAVLHRKDVRITAVIHGAISNLQPLIEETGAQITCGELPVICADHLQLLQLFQNLIGNALKYRDRTRAPRVHISAAKTDSQYLFRVSDNGIGIEAQDRERIFQALKRLHGNEIPGTGIGLAVCRKIVERHGGRIWVESQPGEGSDFCFLLPA